MNDTSQIVLEAIERRQGAGRRKADGSMVGDGWVYGAWYALGILSGIVGTLFFIH